jgi:hypothetical protein
MLAIVFVAVYSFCIVKQKEIAMVNQSAKSHQGVHEDCHGKFTVKWVDKGFNVGWYYFDHGIGCATGRKGDALLKDNEPFDTSEEAYDAACGYGG